MGLTTQEIEQAIELHDSGMSWNIVAAYYKLSTEKLRKQIKLYDETNSKIHESIGTS